ncbi:MAG: 30S ribosomal protein S18 [Planctomycetota bacterium]
MTTESSAPQRRRFRRFSGGFAGRRGDVEFDYKDVLTLKKFITKQGKLHSRKRTNLNKKAQNRLAVAVKHARFMSLLPYTES